MKKIFLIGLILISGAAGCFCQEFIAGVRFSPLNSGYYAHELMSYEDSESMHINEVSQFDSLTLGVYFEKYFSKKAFLLRLDFNYSALKVLEAENDIIVDPWTNSTSEFTQIYKQNAYCIKLGIGTHVNWSKFVFNFGAHVPLTILPEGEITRDISYTSYGVLLQETDCLGKYKPAVGIGIGTFAGVRTILLKHLAVGMEFTYQIEYLSRKLDWHGETHYYGGSNNISTSDEEVTVKNYFTSKIIPSIVVAYAFDIKKRHTD